MSDFSLENKWIDTGGGRINYYIRKKFPDRPTIVYLHGLSANHKTWLKPAELLHSHNYNNLLLDMRGHGLSDKTKRRELYKLPVFSDDLERIIRREKLNRFYLVGYSFGGSVALDYAINRSPTPAGLVLISTNHVNPLEFRRLNFVTPAGRALLETMAWLVRWQQRRQYLNFEPGQARSYWRSVAQGFKTMPWSINLWMLKQIIELDLSERIGEIDSPTLIMHSSHDPFVTKAEVEAMARKLDRAEIHESRNSSHFIASAAQTETAEAILNFLKKYENRDF